MLGEARRFPGHHTMSQQVEFLKNVIDSAQTGNGAAVELLRQVCVSAAEQAPEYDLIAIGRCLYHLGVEAGRATAERN